MTESIPVSSRYRLSDVEMQALRFLAEKHHQGEYPPPFESIPAVASLPQSQVIEIRSRMMNYRLVGGGDNMTDVISELGLHVLHEIDNPPRKDYWADVIAWFRSRWWSVPFLVLLLAIPLAREWYELIVWLVTLIFG